MNFVKKKVLNLHQIPRNLGVNNTYFPLQHFPNLLSSSANSRFRSRPYFANKAAILAIAIKLPIAPPIEERKNTSNALVILLR